MTFHHKKNVLHALLMGSVALIMATKAFSSGQEPLEGAPPYKWSEIYDLTDDPKARDGHQILHFNANKHRSYTHNAYAQEFVDQYCSKAKKKDADTAVLKFASKQAKRNNLKDGMYVELGTGVGETANFLAGLNSKKKIHTFDSYKGLPEDWDKGEGAGSRIIKKGTFALRDPESTFLPPVLLNVDIHVGDFETKLPEFKTKNLKDSPIALLNVDSDIYSSAKIAFDVLGDNIVPGTVIHLDELYNYPNYKQGEWKALQEFIQRKGYGLDFLAFNAVHEQVVVQIKMGSVAIFMTIKAFSSGQEPLEGAPPYKWSEIYDLTDDPKARDGHQVLHFSANKHRPYTDNAYAQEFVDQYCSKAKKKDADATILKFASKQAKRNNLKDGMYVELGTGAGKTANFLAGLNSKKKIHTFDSYEGLPEDWDKGTGSRIIKKGTFALRDPKSTFLPPVLLNVDIHVGDFETKLPEFKTKNLKDSPIALLNVDSDIYSSAKIAFDVLGDNIVPGTVIHLDELYNYPNYKQGEWKALQEFIQRKGYGLDFLAFNAVHEQVVVQIKE